ncbi:MAG: hypothetical protein AAF546_02865 [Verrucomicrobiota bacterium]
MISWIQQRLIRHGRWIFLLLLAVIIVAFVFTIGNTPGCTANRTAYEPNEFYGFDLNSPVEMEPISQRVALSALLNTGRPIQDQRQFQSLAMNRIAALYLADQIGIPSPDAETLGQYLRSKRAFAGPDGQFSADAYSSFIDNIESNPQMDQAVVVAVLEEDYRLDQITTALQGPGYVLPAEAIAQIKGEQTSFTLSTANLSYEEFEIEIEAEEQALREFYEASKFQYEIPERIEASYILFPTGAYTAQVPELEETELRQHFIANRAQFVAEFEAERAAEEAVETPAAVDEENSEQMAEAETEEVAEEEKPVEFEDVRESVTASLIAEKAARLANEAAQAFAYTLYRDEVPRESAAFNTLLSQANLNLTSLEAYTAEQASTSTLSAAMLTSAFDLGGGRYYSDAYELDNGFGVLILEGRLDPVIPPFEDVAAEVEAAYLAEEKRRLFNEEGARLKLELDTRIAAGEDFIGSAESLGLTAKAYDTFKGNEAPQDLNRAVITQAQQMNSGEISPMIQSGGQGFFIYLTEKIVPEVTEDNEDVSRTLSFLKNYSSFLTRNSVMNELISEGLPSEE